MKKIIYFRSYSNILDYMGKTKRSDFWIDFLIHTFLLIVSIFFENYFLNGDLLVFAIFASILVYYLYILPLLTRRLRDVGIEPCLSFLSLLVVPIILILIFCIYRSKDLMTEERFNRVRRIRILIPILVIANILLLIVFLPGFLIVGSLFYDIVILSDTPKTTYLNTNIEDYQSEVSELCNAEDMLPSLSSLTEYEEIKYSYKECLYSTFLGFYSEGISLYVTYDDNYLEKKTEVLNTYDFLEEPIMRSDEYIIPLTEFVHNGYTYQIVMDYSYTYNNTGTCKSFMLIGYSDEKQEIAYHYFYDFDLDFICYTTDDLGNKMNEFMDDFFYYFEDWGGIYGDIK